MRLITKGHRSGTRGSYAGKFQKFAQFCTTEQSRAGRGHLAFLPASQRTLLAYLGSLSEEGIQYIQETSFNPYISTVNQANSLLNLPKPSIGNRVRLLRKGYGEEDGLAIKPAKGHPFSAESILDIERDIDTADPQALRECATVVLAFCFLHRWDAGR